MAATPSAKGELDGELERAHGLGVRGQEARWLVLLLRLELRDERAQRAECNEPEREHHELRATAGDETGERSHTR